MLQGLGLLTSVSLNQHPAHSRPCIHSRCIHLWISDSGILYLLILMSPSDGRGQEQCVCLGSGPFSCLLVFRSASAEWWLHHFLLSEQTPSWQAILCFPVWNCSEYKFKVQSFQELHFYGSCYNICDSNSAKSLLQLPGNGPECWPSIAFCKNCGSWKSFRRKITTFNLELPGGDPSYSLHSRNFLSIVTSAI